MSTYYRAKAFEDGGVSLMARVDGKDASHNKVAIRQNSLSALSLAVFEFDSEAEAEKGTGGTPVSGVGGTLTIADHIFDTLQTGTIWTRDSAAQPSPEDGLFGFNFLFDGPAGCLPNAKWYRFEFKFTPVVGAQFWMVWIVEAAGIATS